MLNDGMETTRLTCGLFVAKNEIQQELTIFWTCFLWGAWIVRDTSPSGNLGPLKTPRENSIEEPGNNFEKAASTCSSKAKKRLEIKRAYLWNPSVLRFFYESHGSKSSTKNPGRCDITYPITSLVGKSLKMTIDLHQLWPPPNMSPIEKSTISQPPFTFRSWWVLAPGKKKSKVLLAPWLDDFVLFFFGGGTPFH